MSIRHRQKAALPYNLYAVQRSSHLRKRSDSFLPALCGHKNSTRKHGKHKDCHPRKSNHLINQRRIAEGKKHARHASLPVVGYEIIVFVVLVIILIFPIIHIVQIFVLILLIELLVLRTILIIIYIIAVVFLFVVLTFFCFIFAAAVNFFIVLFPNIFLRFLFTIFLFGILFRLLFILISYIFFGLLSVILFLLIFLGFILIVSAIFIFPVFILIIVIIYIRKITLSSRNSPSVVLFMFLFFPKQTHNYVTFLFFAALPFIHNICNIVPPFSF